MPRAHRLALTRRRLLQASGLIGAPVLTGPATAAAAVASLPALSPAPPAEPLPARETLLLDQGWRFHAGDIPFPDIQGHGWTYANAKAGQAQGAASPDFDDADWPEVQLPNDWAIAQPLDPKANVSQGYRRRGFGWYRVRLRFDPADRGRHLELQIGAAATHATVWFNGTPVHHNHTGYNGMVIDLTPFATFGEALNTLVVRVDARAMEGWWYEGAGLYRDVLLVKRAPTHLVTDGVFAHPVPHEAGWRLPVEATLYTAEASDQAVTVEVELRDGDTVLDRAQAPATVPSLGRITVPLALHHASPRLWSLDSPTLYTVVTRVRRGGQVLDELHTRCGFRRQHFDADRGFFLNGQPLKIQGVCLHQDHAGVGVAVPAALVEWRLRRLKALGCNAVRCSHHAQDASFMDACDRLGLLVMAENRLFNPSPAYLEPLRWLVRRDRNHPSVFMWSVFNEEPMQGTENGYEMVRRMRAVVRELDTTRPVTAAMNDGLFTPLNVSHALDVLGFNYQQDQYDAVHAARPDLPLISSEDTSALMLRGWFEPTDLKRQRVAAYDDDATEWGATHRRAWKAIAERDFIAGGFVWTGFDYHGEPTPFEWPSNSSLFGIMDLCGFEKTAFHIHQAQWVHDRPVLALVPHWNWAGREGQPVRVMVCSNLDEVELLLNGRSLGRQPVDRWAMNHWTVPYAPGRLEALGVKQGTVVARAQVETTGPAVALRIVPDRPSLADDGRDVQPLRIEAVDAQGRVVPTAGPLAHFDIDGGDIIGLGNGDSRSLEPEQGRRRSLFHGLAQVIVRARPGAAALVLQARAQGLASARVSLRLEATAPPARAATAAPLQTLAWWQRAPLATHKPPPLLAPARTDMNSWSGFRAGQRFARSEHPGWDLCGIDLQPFARVQREGGELEFLDITGACEIYLDGRLVGTKTDPAPAPWRVRLPARPGKRRLSVIFRAVPGQVHGFGEAVRVRAAAPARATRPGASA
jgi:beta-galactosidase